MAYMDRSNHGSQSEATVTCRRWAEQARGETRHCIDDEATRQVLGCFIVKQTSTSKSCWLIPKRKSLSVIAIKQQPR